MDNSALIRVEQQRLELEANIAKLRKSLRHWQTLEIDYEGLREEFLGLPADASNTECFRVAQEFKPDLVDEKELRSLLGEGSVGSRKPHQVADLLAKRVDYVSRNVETVRKQLSGAEKKRNALLLAEDPEYRDVAGLPLTEITEELDEDGNVVSAKLETSDSSHPQLVEVLKRAGVSELVEDDGTVRAADHSPSTPAEPSALPSRSESHSFNNMDSSNKSSLSAQSIKNSTAGANSSVSPSPTDSGSTSTKLASTSPTAIHVTASSPAMVQNKSIISNHPNDTEEDAALRHEMLQYGLGEVGAIVAQLDLEEAASDASLGDDGDETLSAESDFDDDTEDGEDSEDETGKSRNLIISDSYRRKMERLEKKLGLKGMLNVGPSPNLPEEVVQGLHKLPPAKAAGKAAIARAEAASKSSDEKLSLSELKRGTKKATKKKVGFADALDIAPDLKPSQPPAASIERNPEKTRPRPIGDVILERTSTTPSTKLAVASTPVNKKPSRFKSARSDTAQTPITAEVPYTTAEPDPESPSGRVIANTLIERSGPADHSAALPPDPDEIEETMHRRQIATEYHKMRSRMIHQQGGFVGDGEEDNYGEAIAPLPVEDEATGQVKKISRFKAARLK